MRKASGVTDGVAVNPNAEYLEWKKASRSVAIDYCKSMLTTSSGAIAVYFAILKFLGVEKTIYSIQSLVLAIPPLLYLISLLIFALGLRPVYSKDVSPEDFTRFRNDRYRQLNNYMTIGTIFFAVAVLGSILLFVRLLRND